MEGEYVSVFVKCNYSGHIMVWVPKGSDEADAVDNELDDRLPCEIGGLWCDDVEYEVKEV